MQGIGYRRILDQGQELIIHIQRLEAPDALANEQAVAELQS